MEGWLDGNAVQLLENGVRYFPAVLQDIHTARSEIFVESYIFADDRIGRTMVSALCAAAARGVQVHVLVDGFGGRGFVATLMPALLQGGVEVLIYRRELRQLSLRRHRLRRLHRKIILIDRRIAYVGGINIIDDYEPGGPQHPRYDYAVRVEGPLLGPITASVLHVWRLLSWLHLRRGKLPRMKTYAGPASAGRVRARFVIRDNWRHRRDIEDAYLAAMQLAREEIVIACAYFFPGRRFRQALVDAARRGVKVTLLLQGVTDHPLLTYATRALYPDLLSNGIRLFEYQRSQLHAKVAVVDNRWATVGSSNIDPFSLLLAREANVIIDDVNFATHLRQSIGKAIEEGGVEWCEAGWSKLSWTHRLTLWCAARCVRIAIGVAGYGERH